MSGRIQPGWIRCNDMSREEGNFLAAFIIFSEV